MKWIFAALLVFAQNAVLAQSQLPIEIGSDKSGRIAVSAGAVNQRAGNAALVRLLKISNDKSPAFAYTVMVACDGSWVTTGIQAAVKLDNRLSFEELESYAKSQEEAVPLGVMEFQNVGESELFYASLLAKKAPQLCKSAGRERRNTLIPVAGADKGDDTGTYLALLLGTAVKKGSVIDIWTRTTSFKRVPYLDANNQPLELNGVVQKKTETTGRYILDHTAFDCRNRTMGTYESAEYAASGMTPVSFAVPRDQMKPSSIVPGSVGEMMLDAVCRIYGDRK